MVLALSLTPGSVAAQDLYTYTLTVSGGVGGAFDVEPDTGLDNDSLQLSFSLVTASRTLFVARLGEVSFSGDDGFALFTDADLTYFTLGGEYRARRSYYDSGLYIGLGGYQLKGTTPSGEEEDDTAIGLVIGSTADFPINRWLSIQAELSGHITDLDEAQFFAMLHVGVSFHF